MQIKIGSAQIFMELALKEAKLAASKNEVPIGAVVVESGKILAKAHNCNRQLCDSTAHAEIIAIRNACLAKKSYRLDGCEIYITIEPCEMCLAAISLAKISKIYYGANDEKFGAIESGNSCKNFGNNFERKLAFNQIYRGFGAYPALEIYSGISADLAVELMQDFFIKLRQKK